VKRFSFTFISCCSERKTVGKVRNEKISLLRWLYECGVFPAQSLERLVEDRHALDQVTDLKDDLVVLEEVAGLCKRALQDDLATTLLAHVEELQTTAKQTNKEVVEVWMKQHMIKDFQIGDQDSLDVRPQTREVASY
jgi:hypothetical protein